MHSCPYDARISTGTAQACKAPPLDSSESNTFELGTFHDAVRPMASHRGEIFVTKEVHIGSHTA